MQSTHARPAARGCRVAQLFFLQKKKAPRKQQLEQSVGPFASWRLAVLAVALFLLCMLIGVVGAVNMRFEALIGQIATLELELDRPSLTDAWVSGGGVV